MVGRATEVAVIGAGPYGLSIAGHLLEQGVGFRIFGKPMSFWLRMPASINLKSFAFATSVFVPREHYTFPEYCRSHGLEDVEPCTMASFAEYGLWVQRQLLPGLEAVDVTGLRHDGEHFELTLEDGERVRAQRVVVATGLSNFQYVPAELAGLPRELLTHSSEHTSFEQFAGKDVAVVGGGASALEAATILQETGARPLLLVRDAEIVFHSKFDPHRSLRERFRYPNSVLGPGRKSWVLGRFPTLLHYLPEARRVGKVPHRLETRVTAADARGDKVTLHVSEKGGASRPLVFDHVIAGTGYEVDVDRLSFLDVGLRGRIRRVVRAPSLSRHFESSVPGLYFAGPATALSFGPLFRFVAGAAHAAPTVTRHIITRGNPLTRLGRRMSFGAAH